MAQVVNGFKIFCTHGQGNQGILDQASKSSLENEFGTHNEDDVIKQILEKGDVQEGEVCFALHVFIHADTIVQEKGKDGNRNDAKGPMINH